MSNWAKIENGLVVEVLVCDNNDLNGDEGYQWLIDNIGGTWIKTSYNTYGGKHLLGGTPLRKNHAGIGYSYNEILDAFIPPKPFDSWILNQGTCLWEAPFPHPVDKNNYIWNEQTVSWDLLEE